MAAVSTGAQQIERERSSGVAPLENGDHLSASEFLRRYEAMPELKKAELINGIVYLGSPVRSDQHGEPDALTQTWLGTYAIATRGVKAASNATVRLGADDVPQPDSSLRIVPELGGQARLDAKGYLYGAPELVAEVAASSASLDAREKLASYRRAGVREYLVWRTEDNALDWWSLQEDEYRPLSVGADGIIRSRVFPGLWLDPKALLARLFHHHNIFVIAATRRLRILRFGFAGKDTTGRELVVGFVKFDGDDFADAVFLHGDAVLLAPSGCTTVFLRH